LFISWFYEQTNYDDDDDDDTVLLLRTVASSKSAGGTRLPRGHEDRSAEGCALSPEKFFDFISQTAILGVFGTPPLGYGPAAATATNDDDAIQ